MVFKFTIDNLLNQYIPPNRLDRLPKLVGRFLGAHKPTPHHDYLIWIEILVASFAGIALIEGVMNNDAVFSHHTAPMIIASHGASAVLCFNANQTPLAQPRNIILGQLCSSVVGTCIEKLFSLSEVGRSNYWACGALSVAISSVLMSILNCVHPPSGASALLPSADESIRAMGWWYIPAQFVSSCLIVSVALITGNIFRKYPAFWWTPAHVGKQVNSPRSSERTFGETAKNLREGSCGKSVNGPGIIFVPGSNSIKVKIGEILVPTEIDMDELSIEWLDTLQLKLEDTKSRHKVETKT